MGKRKSERYALTALIALVAYGLACFYPTGWSPDSKKVIFPLIRKEGVRALVISDLAGKTVREVARVSDEKARLSPAAWSPDGKWIAYTRVTPKPADPKKAAEGDLRGYAFSLVLQEASSGKERSIFGRDLTDKQADDTKAGGALGPQWTADSRILLMRGAPDEKNEVILLDTTGHVRKRLALSHQLGFRTASLSPDGRYLAYLGESEDEGEGGVFALVRDLQTKDVRRARLVATGGLDDELDLRPAWAPDSSALYFAVVKGAGRGAGSLCQVEAFPLRKGKARPIWKREGANVLSVGAASRSPLLAITYKLDRPDLVGIDVVDPGSGRATPVHFSRSPFYSVSISPDGRWVAFCPETDNDFNVGAIVSATGSRMTLFAPHPEQKAATPEIRLERLDASLEFLKRQGLIAKAQPRGRPTPKEMRELAATLDRIEGKLRAPLFAAAIAFARVEIYVDRLQRDPPVAPQDFARDAYAQLERFKRAYPGHPAAPALKKALDSLLGYAPDKSEAPREDGKPWKP